MSTPAEIQDRAIIRMNLGSWIGLIAGGMGGAALGARSDDHPIAWGIVGAILGGFAGNYIGAEVGYLAGPTAGGS